MKHGLFYTIGIIVLSIVSVTTSPAQVVMQPLPIGVPSAPGPYYAPPSWDQKLPSASRFIILSDWGNAAVLDKETGLVWERAPSRSKFDWKNAQYYCNNLSVANRKGWRVPTVQELASLVDMSVPPPGPTLPPGHPFYVLLSDPYFWWSENTSFELDANAWGVRFDDGRVGGNPKNYSSFVWCVRGGHGVDRK
jgi:hypothetical protein